MVIFSLYDHKSAAMLDEAIFNVCRGLDVSGRELFATKTTGMEPVPAAVL